MLLTLTAASSNSCVWSLYIRVGNGDLLNYAAADRYSHDEINLWVKDYKWIIKCVFSWDSVFNVNRNSLLWKVIFSIPSFSLQLSKYILIKLYIQCRQQQCLHNPVERDTSSVLQLHHLLMWHALNACWCKNNSFIFPIEHRSWRVARSVFSVLNFWAFSFP